MVVAGTRPEIVKLAPVLEWLERLDASPLLVWSGQHYDYSLSRAFFDSLGLPEPDEDLHAGSGTHAGQTSRIMIRLERLVRRFRPPLVVAEGDTNTVVAASLTSLKCLTSFAHVEAGLRSWNMRMPEEVNRKISDAIATMHFAPTRLAAANLLFEGTSPRTVHVTGNTIVDVVYKYGGDAKKMCAPKLSKLELDEDNYILVTLHRQENTDVPARLRSIMVALKKISHRYDVVFPMHPRTRKIVRRLGLAKLLRHVKVTQPMDYFDFLGLLANCRAVLTDSGGVQEEAFTLKVPTVTLRYSTERPETTMYGLNKLAGAESELIERLALEQARSATKMRAMNIKNPLGDGRAGEKIARLLRDCAGKGAAIKEPDMRRAPAVTYALIDSKSRKSSVLELVAGFTSSGEAIPEVDGAHRILARVKRKLVDTCLAGSE